MTQFRTAVKVEPHSTLLNYSDKSMFIGSCFASNIGERFQSAKLPCCVNPYGVIYNPSSVASTLINIINNYIYTDEDVQLKNNQWHSFYHHSNFNRSEKLAFLENANEKNQQAHDFLKSSRFLFITFGTAWVYQLAENKQIVSNCHKYPSRNFNRNLLTVDQIVDQYRDLLLELKQFNPDLNIILTVSPVRHWKDGAHGNQISKSTLLLAVDQLVKEFEFCEYFPAYEIQLDDLRDYRFFDEDMVHPNKVAIEYIWNHFQSAFFSKYTLHYIKEMLKLDRAINHRSFDVTSHDHQTFLKSLLKKLNEFKLQYPEVNFDYEVNLVQSNIL